MLGGTVYMTRFMLNMIKISKLQIIPNIRVKIATSILLVCGAENGVNMVPGAAAFLVE